MDSRYKESPRSTQNSSAATPTPDPGHRSPKPVPIDATTTNADSKPKAHYIVFIRLPFPRNDFQDPPPVQWDAAKDEKLWKIISGSSGKELNWEEMSIRFQVSLPFLLQQAAWLYERRFESMKAQMKRLGVSGTATPSPPILQREKAGVGGESMVRTGSRDSQKPSTINTQRSSPLPTGEMLSSPGTPRSNKPMCSRTPSTTTVTQSRIFAASPRPSSQVLGRAADGSAFPKARPSRAFGPSQDRHGELGLSREEMSQSESEDEPVASSRSQAVRRAALSKKPVMDDVGSDGDVDDDDEDDDSGGFLPFATGSKSTKTDPTATLRNSPSKQTMLPQHPSTNKGKTKEPPPSSSTSSASSAQHPLSSNGNGTAHNAGMPNRPRPPLSPRHRAELEKLSPRYKKSGSEGSPSMGSSFSDLDDASVTQSALDDAILSNMQHQSLGMTLGAGVGSRMGALRDALGRK